MITRRVLLGTALALGLAGTATAEFPERQIERSAKQGALASITIFPAIMLVAFIGLLLYFRMRGGYRPVELASSGAVAGGH